MKWWLGRLRHDCKTNPRSDHESNCFLMRILWIKSDFLHPTTRGGQIRTLEMLKRLHRRHEIHYVAFEDRAQPEGPARAAEYCARAYPVEASIPPHGSPRFAAQLAAGLFSQAPVAVLRYRSRPMRRLVAQLLAQESFDSVVCDFLAPALNIPDLEGCILFQHNVETLIWRRRLEQARDPLRRFYLRRQAQRMFELERRVCRAARAVVAVSAPDAQLMRTLFGVSRLWEVPTGVDVESFAPPPVSPPLADLVFVGSMDWLPNIDGVGYFVREILPRIRRRRPDCTVAIAGRRPPAEIADLARRDPRILVTGTVSDIRPYLWGAKVSVVPLRIGGGTRLKIYESMAARVPVVSTTVGAEGLEVKPGEDLLIADTAGHFADRCMELLDDASQRRRLADGAWELVASRFSWEQVARQFERILEEAAVTAGAGRLGAVC